MPTYGNNRGWCGILYQENMVDGWRSKIDNLLQLPYCYCEHTLDKDSKSEHRKDHVHLMVVWAGPTTYKHAMEVMQQLSAPGKKCLSTCRPIYGMRNCYDYLIHDTPACQAEGKYKYPPEARICGNNFDIGDYEQISKSDKDAMFDFLTDFIIFEEVQDFATFIEKSRARCVDTIELWREVIRGHSAYFERVVNGVFHRRRDQRNEEFRQACDARKVKNDADA